VLPAALIILDLRVLRFLFGFCLLFASGIRSGVLRDVQGFDLCFCLSSERAMNANRQVIT